MLSFVEHHDIITFEESFETQEYLSICSELYSTMTLYDYIIANKSDFKM